MPSRFHLVAAAGLAMLLGGERAAVAQVAVGSPVDRNVGDTGPNAASQRLVQPGIGQFGVGSLLLDRYDNNPYQPTRHDPFAGDPRVSQRYLLSSPGVTALIARPDYIGPSPNGGWVANSQTFDGTEVMTLTGADTVFVLSPELLSPTPTPVRPEFSQAYAEDSPHRVQARPLGDPYAYMRGARLDGQSSPALPNPAAVHRPDTYRHPEIIERQRRLREERDREAREREAAEQAEAEQTGAEQAEAKQADEPAQGSADEPGRDTTPQVPNE